MTVTGWIVAAAAFLVAAVVFFLLGIRYRKSVAEKEISSAEDEATRIINEAIKSSENKKREALLEAKEEILKNRSEYEKEVKERRAEQQKLEDAKDDIGWGHQIRSYVLDQSRIKDLRTNVENTNTTAVLNGDLDQFIEASLKQGV